MKTRFTKLIPIVFISLTLFLNVGEVEGKSVSWSWNYNGYLWYYWNNSGATTGGWAGGLANPIGTVLYGAQIRNADTNEIIEDNSLVQVGTNIVFENITHANTDISWFGSGYSADSPFGHWVNNAGIVPACNPEDKPNSIGGVIAAREMYTPLSVNPPVITYDHTGSTANLSCDVIGKNCTVTGPGTIIGNVNFQNTYAKFYYSYITISYLCISNNIPMAAGGVSGPNINPYILNIPAQTITFSLTAVSNNNPPTPPTITGVSSANLGTTNTFTFNATDIDGDTIKYEIDWNNDGVVDGLSPTSGFVSSGSNSTSNYTLPSTGTTFTFKARTADSKGGVSAWTTKTVTLLQAINGECGQANGEILSSAPSGAALCFTPGVASSITTNPTTWTWTCSGTNGGNPSPTCTTTKQGPMVNVYFSLLDRLKLFTSNLLSNSTLIDRVLAYDIIE